MLEEQLIDSMARTLWVDAWADWNEEYGKVKTSGKELMDLAPKTPRLAKILAAMLLGRYDYANGDYGVWWVVKLASDADGIAWLDVISGQCDAWLGSLAHYLAMMSLGHGVSWFDDHEEFALVVPHVMEDISDFFTTGQWFGSKYDKAIAKKERNQPNDN